MGTKNADVVSVFLAYNGEECDRPREDIYFETIFITILDREYRDLDRPPGAVQPILTPLNLSIIHHHQLMIYRSNIIQALWHESYYRSQLTLRTFANIF